jgi:hypothetical protein
VVFVLKLVILFTMLSLLFGCVGLLSLLNAAITVMHVSLFFVYSAITMYIVQLPVTAKLRFDSLFNE